MNRFHLALVTAIALSVSCSNSDATSPPPAVDHDAVGSWVQDNHGSIFPGSSFTVMLIESSGQVTGTGTFAGEAGPFGTLSVSGTVANKALALRIVSQVDPQVFPGLGPDTEQYVGMLIDRDHIAGQVTRGGTTSAFDLVRAKSANAATGARYADP